MAGAESLNKAMVVGSGGREQAFAWALAQSPYVDEVIIAPGNAGTQDISTRLGKPISNRELLHGTTSDIMDLVRAERPSLVVVGPEAWLEQELGDMLAAERIPAIAPQADRAILETSKVTAREKGREWRIPQPEFHIFTSIENGLAFIDSLPENSDGIPLIAGSPGGVIKVDGLAAGKGVTVCSTKDELRAAIIQSGRFGKAASRLLVEERLVGKEVSYIVLADGTEEDSIPFVTAMDHKRLLDGDKGPNTGGMGVTAPNPYVSVETAEAISNQIIRPTLKGMYADGKPYKGLLFAGVMLTEKGPMLVEFNCRGGDPETQAQLVLLETDLYQLFRASTNGTLNRMTVNHRNQHSATVVLASEGYPDKPHKGQEIQFPQVAQLPQNVSIFHAGTIVQDGRLVIDGGRIAGVTAVGDTLADALRDAYKWIKRIQADHTQYRGDIGRSSSQS